MSAQKEMLVALLERANVGIVRDNGYLVQRGFVQETVKVIDYIFAQAETKDWNEHQSGCWAITWYQGGAEFTTGHLSCNINRPTGQGIVSCLVDFAWSLIWNIKEEQEWRESYRVVFPNIWATNQLMRNNNHLVKARLRQRNTGLIHSMLEDKTYTREEVTTIIKEFLGRI